MKKRIGRKLSALRLPLAILAVAACLSFPRTDPRARTAGLSLVSAASAQGLFAPVPDYAGEEEGQLSLAINRFLRTHGKIFFAAVPAAMLILYILIMGPADVWDSYRRVRRSRYGGFGSDGGFGGRAGF